MDIFSVDFTENELNFIRQSLETVSIQGRDAKFLANLQIKLENELTQIHNMLNAEEQNKAFIKLKKRLRRLKNAIEMSWYDVL